MGARHTGHGSLPEAGFSRVTRHRAFTSPGTMICRIWGMVAVRPLHSGQRQRTPWGSSLCLASSTRHLGQVNKAYSEGVCSQYRDAGWKANGGR